MILPLMNMFKSALLRNQSSLNHPTGSKQLAHRPTPSECLSLNYRSLPQYLAAEGASHTHHSKNHLCWDLVSASVTRGLGLHGPLENVSLVHFCYSHSLTHPLEAYSLRTSQTPLGFNKPKQYTIKQAPISKYTPEVRKDKITPSQFKVKPGAKTHPGLTS
jgi:hypothetical protein